MVLLSLLIHASILNFIYSLFKHFTELNDFLSISFIAENQYFNSVIVTGND